MTSNDHNAPRRNDQMSNDQVRTSDLVDALETVMNVIDAKGVETCKPEIQKAYQTMRDFVVDAKHGNDHSFAVIYYP